MALVDLTTINRFVITEPFETTSVQIEKRKGFAIAEQKVSITALTVLSKCRTDKLSLDPGDKVWVPGDACSYDFAKKVLEMDGVKFVIVPEDRIVGFSKGLDPLAAAGSMTKLP